MHFQINDDVHAKLLPSVMFKFPKSQITKEMASDRWGFVIKYCLERTAVMSGFYSGFNVTGSAEEIARFKAKFFRSYDESKGYYGPFEDSMGDVIIDFTAVCPRLVAKQALLDRKNPPTYMPEYRGYDVDHADYDDGTFWFQFTIDSDFPVELFDMIALQFPDLVFSGSAYEETNEFEYEGEFNGSNTWERTKIQWSSI